MQDEVVVVTHQAIAQGCGIEARQCQGDDLEERQAVLVFDKDVFAPVTTCADVIDGTGELDAQRSSHAGRLREVWAKDKA